MPRAPAFGGRRRPAGGPATQPMPVCTSGWRTPTRSVSGVRSAGRSSRTSRSRAVRVEHLADQRAVRPRSAPGCAARRPATQREAGGLRTCRPSRPGGPSAAASAVRRGEVEYREVGDDTPELVEARRGRAGRRRAVVADAAHHVDPVDEDPRGVPRHPVARRVVQRVDRARRARRAAGGRAAPSRRCRRCSGCRSGRSGSRPSSRAACRRVTIARCLRYGSQPSVTVGAAQRRDVADEHRLAVGSSRSGAKVSCASRAPRAGTGPMGPARISPSPRQASAQATTQYSARVAVTGRPAHRCSSCQARHRPTGTRSRSGRTRKRPVNSSQARGRRRRRVGALEGLVAVVVGSAGGEVRAVRGLDHPADRMA